MDDTIAPEDALLPRIANTAIDAWLPAGDSILVERRQSKHYRHERRLEAWSRAFVLSRLRVDGAWDCTAIDRPAEYAIVTRTADGSRLYIQSSKPEAENG